MSRFFREGLSKLSAYTPGEQPMETNLIKLNTNENPYPPAPAVRELISKASSASALRPLNRYPEPDCGALVSALAGYHGVSRDMIAVGNGSDEILAFAFIAFGAKANAPEVSYGFYPVFGEMFSKTLNQIPLNPALEIDPADYMGLDGTIVIANPNAPTGTVLGLEDISSILGANKSNLVIVDEAYIDFGGRSAIELLAGYDNLMIIRTFSKSRSLAGLRIGYAVGSADIIADINKIKFSFNPYSLDSLAMAAAAASLKDEEYFEETVRRIMNTRDDFADKLSELGFTLLPSAANFVFARHGRLSGGECHRLLREKNILVRYFDKEPIKDYIRITIGTDEEMKAMLKATKEILNENI